MVSQASSPVGPPGTANRVEEQGPVDPVFDPAPARLVDIRRTIPMRGIP